VADPQVELVLGQPTLNERGLEHLGRLLAVGMRAPQPAQQALWRSPDRWVKFAQLLVDLINHGAFGPLCGEADRVRLARAADGRIKAVGSAPAARDRHRSRGQRGRHPRR
jgi:hypothetical protein